MMLGPTVIEPGPSRSVKSAGVDSPLFAGELNAAAMYHTGGFNWVGIMFRVHICVFVLKNCHGELVA